MIARGVTSTKYSQHADAAVTWTVQKVKQKSTFVCLHLDLSILCIIQGCHKNLENLEKPGKLHFWAKIPGKPGKWHLFQGKEILKPGISIFSLCTK